MDELQHEQHPLISIIIPSYNRAVLIQETLDSIIAQTFENWECVVVDDLSSDDSMKVLDRYARQDSRFKIFSRPVERHKGPSACRNFGFENSCGDYILFFDSDDIMETDFLELVAGAIENSDHQVELLRVCYDLFFKSPEQTYYYATHAMSGTNVLEAACSNISWMRPSTLTWKRELLARQNRLWNEDLMRYEDYELFYRLFLDFNDPQNVEWIEHRTLVHARSSHKSLSSRKPTAEIQQLLYDITTVFFTACKEGHLVSTECLEKNLEYFCGLHLNMICSGWPEFAMMYENFINEQKSISVKAEALSNKVAKVRKAAFYYRMMQSLRSIKAHLIPLAVKEFYWKLKYPKLEK